MQASLINCYTTTHYKVFIIEFFELTNQGVATILKLEPVQAGKEEERGWEGGGEWAEERKVWEKVGEEKLG